MCILEGSLVRTSNAGFIPVETLDPQKHTINNNRILYIYKHKLSKPTDMIRFEKNSFGKEMPFKDTYLTIKHLVYHPIQNQLFNANRYATNNKIINVTVNNRYIYQILLDNIQWQIMNVGNLLCESLCPYQDRCISKYIENNQNPNGTDNKIKEITNTIDKINNNKMTDKLKVSNLQLDNININFTGNNLMH
jgi:hypothetical protein